MLDSIYFGEKFGVLQEALKRRNADPELIRGVAAVHGAAFMYPGHLRISYATDTESLVKACERIQHFCEGLR